VAATGYARGTTDCRSYQLVGEDAGRPWPPGMRVPHPFRGRRRLRPGSWFNAPSSRSSSFLSWSGCRRGDGGRLRDEQIIIRSVLCGEGGGAGVRFGVQVRNDNREGTPPLVRLKAVCSPGDQGEPVVTVMLPSED
jgi:hypothetical protein